MDPGLAAAAEAGDAEAVAVFLAQEDVDVNARDEQGGTALFAAAWRGSVAVLRLMLDAGADASARDDEGAGPLFLAAQEGHEAAARLLVDSGADATAADEQGSTALHACCRAGHLGVATMLVGSGAAVDAASSSGATPLSLAASAGHEEVARYLLAQGADQDHADADGVTPLIIASQKGFAGVVGALLERSADVHCATADGWSALWVAAAEQQPEVAGLLLAAGARADQADSEGVTPLAMAERGGNAELIQVLGGAAGGGGGGGKKKKKKKKKKKTKAPTVEEEIDGPLARGEALEQQHMWAAAAEHYAEGVPTDDPWLRTTLELRAANALLMSHGLSDPGALVSGDEDPEVTDALRQALDAVTRSVQVREELGFIDGDEYYVMGLVAFHCRRMVDAAEAFQHASGLYAARRHRHWAEKASDGLKRIRSHGVGIMMTLLAAAEAEGSDNLVASIIENPEPLGPRTTVCEVSESRTKLRGYPWGLQTPDVVVIFKDAEERVQVSNVRMALVQGVDLDAPGVVFWPERTETTEELRAKHTLDRRILAY